MMRLHDFFTAIAREADKPGGLAAAASAATVGAAAATTTAATATATTTAAPADATAATATATDAAAATAATAAPAVYHPEGLGDAYRGKTDKETIDALWKDIQTRPRPPETPDGYKFEVKPELAPFVDVSKDPVLPLWGKVAHELQLSPQQAQGAFEKLFGEMAKAGLLEQPIDVNAEFAALSDGKGDRAAQVAAGMRAATEAADTVKALATRGQIPADLANELTVMMSSAKSTRAVQALLALLPKAGGNEPGVGGGAAAAASAMAAEDVLYGSPKKSA